MSTNLLKHDRVIHQMTFHQKCFAADYLGRCHGVTRWPLKTCRYPSPSKIQQSWQQSRGNEGWWQTEKTRLHRRRKGLTKGQRWLDSRGLHWYHFWYHLPLNHIFFPILVYYCTKRSQVLSSRHPEDCRRGEVLVGRTSAYINWRLTETQTAQASHSCSRLSYTSITVPF